MTGAWPVKNCNNLESTTIHTPAVRINNPRLVKADTNLSGIFFRKSMVVKSSVTDAIKVMIAKITTYIFFRNIRINIASFCPRQHVPINFRFNAFSSFNVRMRIVFPEMSSGNSIHRTVIPLSRLSSLHSNTLFSPTNTSIIDQ
ncbi:unknown [Roseburia sp. CAG:309]|nr:unknown [Roseburia sp. CAG:309]